MAFVYMNFNRVFSLLKTLPFFTLIFLVSGCQFMETVESDKIPQSEIKQTYTVNATRDETRVSATFSQGGWGKSVDLDAPSKIEHNDGELPQNSSTFLTGTFYAQSFSGVEKNHRFVYTNNDGKVFRNELSFEPIEIETQEISVSRSRETVVRFSRAVGKDEKVSINLESTVKPPEQSNTNVPKKPDSADYDIYLNDELDESRAAIVLKPKNLKNFVRGKAVLKIQVSREIPLQQATPAGGSMNWNYTTTTQINITD